MKKAIGLLISAAMVTAGLAAPAAGRQEAPPPVVPETVVIDDPFQDANGLNDQGNGGATGFQGDNVTAADAGSASDIGKVWFSDDATTVSAHIQVQLPPPASQGLRFDVFTAPGSGSAGESTIGCAQFVAVLEGKAQGQSTTWQGPNEAKFFDACNDGTHWFNNGVEAQVVIHTLEDGTGVITITATKDSSPFLATGQTLSQTTAVSRIAYGVSGTSQGRAFYIDNTKPGIDFMITGGELEEEEKPLPPGCKKGKGKKKGCKKKGG